MPATKSIFHEIGEEEEERAIAEAEADVAAGRVVPHEEVAKWLKSWGMLDELPCPFTDEKRGPYESRINTRRRPVGRG